MQLKNEVVKAEGRKAGSRLWFALGGLLAALLAMPFLASALLDLGDESLTDLVIGLGACWLAAKLFLMAGKRTRRARSLLPELRLAIR